MVFKSPTDVHADVAASHAKRRLNVRAGCANGLYLAPAANAQIDTSQSITLKWDNTCFDPSTKAVDLYLTAPLSDNTAVYAWYGLDYTKGMYDAELKPKWWNSTASISLQLNMVEAGFPPGLTEFAAAPIWTATYNAAAAATNTHLAAAANTAIPDQPYVVVNNIFHGGGLKRGQLAAAVLMPLLTVFTCLGYYVWRTRQKEAKKRQRWSQAVDKRMSTISTDWKSMSGAAASHAIRHSMVVQGDRRSRASSFFAGNGPLPSVAFGGEAGRPGSRYNGLGLGGSIDFGDASTPLPRPITLATMSPAARTSRAISFAADPRPSVAETRTNSIYSRNSRAAYQKSFYATDGQEVPPLPNRGPSVYAGGDEMEMEMSPTQTQGPNALSPSEIRAKISAATVDNEVYGRPSVDELLRMPAMTLMRTSEKSDDMVLTPTTPAITIDYPLLSANSAPRSPVPPSPAATSPFPAPSPIPSTFSGMTPLMNTDQSSYTSPDAMLRAYAAKKAATALTGVKRRNTGAQATHIANGGMRVLYEPPTALQEEDAYGGYDAYEASQGHGSEMYGTDSDGHNVAVGTHQDYAAHYNNQRLTVEVGSNNPFRSNAVSGAFSDTSRYSTMEHGHAQ